MVAPLAPVLPVGDAPVGSATGGGRAHEKVDPASAPAGTGLRAALETLGLVAGPATLLGALAVFFGVTYTNAQAFYFGIDGSTLPLSSQDYLLRSADSLFVPVGAIVLGGLLLLWCHSCFTGWLVRPERGRALTTAIWAMGPSGAVLLAIGASAVFRPLPFRTPFLFAPLSVVAGIVGLSYAVSLRRRRTGPVRPARTLLATANVVLVGMVVVVGLFWGTSDYAKALGRGRAQLLHARLPVRPGAVVYTDRRLGLEGPGVQEEVVAHEGDGYRYRYSGLRLFTRAGDRLILLPAQWSPAQGRAIILRDDERVRIEFVVGSLG